MIIQNEIFYHFHRNNDWDEKWTVGNSFIIDKTMKNDFIKHYDTKVPVFSIKGVPHCAKIASKKMIEILQSLTLQDFYNYLDYSLTVFSECGMFIREVIFEEVRISIDPELPSRKSCIWVLEEDAIDYWKKVLGPNLSLFKVKLNGILHKTDQMHLFDEIVEHDKIRSHAFKYWAGTDGKNNEQVEALFEGKIEVLEKCSYSNSDTASNIGY